VGKGVSASLVGDNVTTRSALVVGAPVTSSTSAPDDGFGLTVVGTKVESSSSIDRGVLLGELVLPFSPGPGGPGLGVASSSCS
jgi:hypothetical protein